VALPFLRRELCGLLTERGREDLADSAVGAIGLTDDGGTIYVHLHPQEGWSHRAPGRVFVLAWEDYVPEGSSKTYCHRWLAAEARRSLHENVEKIARWLDGK
jgi:hypothetical protein